MRKVLAILISSYKNTLKIFNIMIWYLHITKYIQNHRIRIPRCSSHLKLIASSNVDVCNSFSLSCNECFNCLKLERKREDVNT